MTVIVKQIIDAGGTGFDGDTRYAREIAALRLVGRATGPAVAPALLGTGPGARVMVWSTWTTSVRPTTSRAVTNRGAQTMSPMQTLSLLLGLSIDLNIAITAGILTHRSGAGVPQAILTGSGAAATGLGIYFAAVAAYRSPPMDVWSW
ncbi:hypothetical protein ACF05W_32670 [Streptomyces lydicus]|uniref:hypothetical protein n=1 Tax=Streptomyces lydicus TaxID=47763 RepID=UPI0036FAD906